MEQERMVSPSVSLTITPTDGEDVSDFLRDLAARLDGFRTSTASAETPGPSNPRRDPRRSTVAEGWTVEYAVSYLGRLAPSARKGLRYIAQHAPQMPFEAVIEATGAASGYALGGMMSSLGSNMKHVPEGLPLPAVSRGEYYFIDHEVAAVFRSAFERLAETDDA
jgi:hypothetical protein